MAIQGMRVEVVVVVVVVKVLVVVEANAQQQIHYFLGTRTHRTRVSSLFCCGCFVQGQLSTIACLVLCGMDFTNC